MMSIMGSGANIRIPPNWKSPEWEDVVQREKMLRERYQFCPLVLHMLQDLMDQLEARSKRRNDGG